MKEKEVDLGLNITLTRINRKSRKIIDRLEFHNIVATLGLGQVNDFLANVAVTAPTHIAIGEGTTAETVGDTALETEQDRQSATITEPSSVSTKYEHEFTFGSGISFAITELGLFNASSGGTMFNRATFSARNVDDTISLIATVIVTVSQ